MANQMILGLNVVEAVTLKAPDRQQLFGHCKDLGVTTVRIELPWLEVKNGITTVLAPAVNDALTAGLDVLGMVAHNPSPKPSAAQFGTDMAKLAGTFPTIKFWEIWNEPNLEEFWPGKTKPETYVPYLQSAYAAIKKVNGAATVLFGGLAACATASRPWYAFWEPAFYNYSPIDFLTRAYAAGAGGHFDALALHPYSDDAGFRHLGFASTDPYLSDITPIRALMSLNGDGAKDVWGTEYGYSVNDWNLQQQSDNLMAQTRWMADKFARGYIFSLRDTQGNYGLMDKNNVERIAYASVKGYVAT